MRSDLIDIVVEDKGDEVIISLSGMFGIKEFAALKEKLERLLQGPGIFFYLNLDKAIFLSPEYLGLFLDQLNSLKKRRINLVLLFANEENKEYFSRYSSVFEISESLDAYHRQGFLSQLRQIGLHYSRQSGLRITRWVAITGFLFLAGWFFTLFMIISKQNDELSERQKEITLLESKLRRSVMEIERLESSIGPLQNLGIVGNTEELSSFGTVKNWILYLDKLDSLRREK